MASGIERIAAAAMGDPIEALSSQGEVGMEKDVKNASLEIKEDKHVSGDNHLEKSQELSYPGDISLEGCAPTDAAKVEIISNGLSGMWELQPGNWEQMTPAERLDALAQVENFVSEVTLRPPCRVVSEAMDGMHGYHQGGKIALNEDLLKDSSPEGMRQALETLLHEGRHAYQHWNTDVIQVEPSGELVNSWKLNWDMGYENGDSGLFDFQNMGLKRYLTQPVEVDARVFAESVLQATNFNGGYYA